MNPITTAIQHRIAGLTNRKPAFANAMSLNSLRHLSWLRTAMAVLVLCFALGSITHAGHRHEQNSAGPHVVCDYCTSFGSLVDAPLQTAQADGVPPAAERMTASSATLITTRPVGVAQARAPPLF